MIRHQLEIHVQGPDGQVLTGADVVAEPEAVGDPVQASFDTARLLYFFDGLRPGFYSVAVRHQDFVPETRRIQVHPKPSRALFILGTTDSAFTYRGGARVPYSPQPDLIGIIPNDLAAATEGALQELLASVGLTVEDGPEADEPREEPDEAAPSDTPTAGALIARRSAGELDDLDNEDLSVLRASPLVAAAGPLFQRAGAAFSVFTNQLFVRFRPDVGRAEIDRILAGEGLRLVQPLAFSPNLFLVEADASIGLGINQVAERLVATGRVEYAEPNLAEVPELDAVTPTDWLFAGEWDRQLVGVEDAWQHLLDDPGIGAAGQFGSPNVIIGVVDQGIRSVAGTPENADFQGTVSNGSSKTYQLFNFSAMVANNDAPFGDHGVACGGIALGQAENLDAAAGVGIGIAGAAPNTRLIGLIYPGLESWRLEMYLWAAGLDPRSTRPGFPAQITPGADIFSTSIGFGSGAALSQAAQDMFDYLTSRGRGGKGCMAFFSAGNNPAADIVTYRPYGWYDRSFSCAASSLDPAGNEIRAPYSGFGLVEWCAPSSSGGQVHNPPESYGTWTVAFAGTGNLPAVPTFTTALSADAPAAARTQLTAFSTAPNVLLDVVSSAAFTVGQRVRLRGTTRTAFGEIVTIASIPGPTQIEVDATTNNHAAGREVVAETAITVADTSGFAVDQWILMGDPGDAGSEPVLVTNVVDATTLNVIGPLNAQTATTPVHGGTNNYRNRFGGTSSATPLSAGIAGLVLSAQPGLTWVEAREIMRNTAVKFDLANTDPVGRWLDANGDPITVSGLPAVFSRWYGYGRLDADAAVTQALAYAFSRDLMLRDDLADTGTVATAPSADSPDIWVRNADPAVDAGAIPAGYGIAGPHQTLDYAGQRWVYARVRNRGTIASLDAWVRFYIASSDGTPFVHPADWEPRNGLGNTTPGSWQPETYLIGEVAITGVPAGSEQIVNIPWDTAMMPPPIAPGGAPWNPHLLVEVTPHDGPLTGTVIEDNNNLAQKAITIVDTLAPAVEFSDGSGNPLDRTIPVPSTVPGVSVPFAIRISDQGLFDVDAVTFDVTWLHRDGTPTTVNLAFDGTTWVPAAAPPTTLTLANPVGATGGAASGVVFEAIFDGTFEAVGAFEHVQIQVNVSDLAGNATPAVAASRLVEISVPTDMMLVLDYSGSMLTVDGTGQSKWDSAKEAANLFNAIYTALDSPALDNRIGLVRFFADGFAGPDLTEVTEAVSAPSTAVDLVDDPDPATPNFWTPMGSGVVTGYGELAPPAADWRSRVMILLTDGMENRSPMLAAVRSAISGDPNYTPSVTEDAQLGCRIHACAFGPPGDVDTGAIQLLALGGDGLKHYDGQLHSTETTADPNAAFALKEQFLSLLADTLPAEVIGPFPSNFNVELGVTELVCIVTDNVAFTVTAPPEHTAPIGAVSTHTGFSWVRISDPAPGAWSLGGFAPSATVQGFAVVDLTLQATFDAGRTGIGVGRPIPLWAEIKEEGVGVSGAAVTVEVVGPGESMGQVITDYVTSAAFGTSRLATASLRPLAVAAGVTVTPAAQLTVEPPVLRRQLLLAAQQARGLDLRHRNATVTLTETTTPGRYEGEFANTVEEGTYTFRFRATGSTSSGHTFERDYVNSRHLEPVPDPVRTSVTWSSTPLLSARTVQWKATIVPQTASGRPLGAGLGHKLTLRVGGGTRAAAAARTPLDAASAIEAMGLETSILEVTDNLDGGYSATLELPAGQAPPPLELGFGAHVIPVSSGPAQCRRVRITATRIQVLDDKEPWFLEPGELTFDAVVVPNRDPNRMVRRRIPTIGRLRLRDGEIQDLDIVLFDGYVEEGASLDISIGGTEFDWFLFFTKRDPLARYRRRITGSVSSWAGSYAPGDETDDPESLDDWKVWYEIEVL